MGFFLFIFSISYSFSFYQLGKFQSENWINGFF